MRKGEETRTRVLSQALTMASLGGLQSLSVGGLAGALGMSKSGLFAHFGSKEQLQRELLEHAVERFRQVVFVPALREPAGEPRLRALFDHWLAWDRGLAGGCVFDTAASEIDELPRPVQERLVEVFQDWFHSVAGVAAAAVAAGRFRADLDVRAFAFEFVALGKGYHHFSRMMRDPAAESLTRGAFESLLERSRA
jgi:AcrR family transcriptional regulator